MELLTKDECLEYSGGSKLGLALGAIMTAAGAFFLGFIDGIFNPKKCNAR